MLSANPAIEISYDYFEVALSLLIAVSACYVALDLAQRVTAAHGRARMVWLTGGAVALGVGIWSMHFTAMLALHLAVPMAYHWPTVLVSLLIGILSSSFALFVASRKKMGPADALSGSVIMGVGIAGLHYSGMAAMRLAAAIRYNIVLVGVSIVLAIAFSVAALLLAFDLREETRATVPRKFGSALVMGAAISAMHYTGMAAVTFVRSTASPNLSHAVSISSVGTAGIAVVTLIILAQTMFVSSMDRRSALQTLELAREQAKTELARLSRIGTMTHLTASIAHEINQPITAVVTSISAALRWQATQPPNLDEAREAMVRGMEQANRVSEVIGGIRTLLKKASPELQPIDINAVIQDAVALAGNELLTGAVTVRTELVADIPAVLGDRIQLQQVMLNLIMNAIDAMSMITDRQRELLIKSAKNPDGLLIQVQDSGKGLDVENVERIFEPFFTTKPQGIGMGLWISRLIVEGYGGRLWANPRDPHGAVFQIILPKADNVA